MHIELQNITPLKNYCRVEKSKTDIITASGIELSESQSYTTPVMGTVLEAGSKSMFKKGDILFFRRYSIDELKMITDEGEQVVNFVQDSDVIAVYSYKRPLKWYNKIINLILK